MNGSIAWHAARWYSLALPLRERRVLETGGMVARGRVKWFSDAKGYGFIENEEDGQDLFVHYTEIVGEGFKTLEEGCTVEFDIIDGRRGKKQASRVKVVD